MLILGSFYSYESGRGRGILREESQCYLLQFLSILELTLSLAYIIIFLRVKYFHFLYSHC